MAKNEQGSGTIRAIRDRKTKAIVGYQALLPRELSKAPPNCKNPAGYQTPCGQRQATWIEARKLLDAVIEQRIEVDKLAHGRTFGAYLLEEVKVRENEAKLTYKNADRARKHLSAWRAVDKHYLSKAPWYDWPPSKITIDDLQSWFDWLREQGQNSRGNPLGRGYIRNISAMVGAVFRRAKVKPNPVDSVEFKKPVRTEIEYLSLAEQQTLFGSDEIELADRIMIGCGMGSGLRVGELLSLEMSDLHLDAADPHLYVRYGGPGHAPPKGREVGRVELYEPALGFYRLWLERYYRGGRLVFGGPRDNYRTGWPNRFSRPTSPDWRSWSEIVGKRMHSHMMRHSFAVSMLSGLWRYEPQSLEFIQQQLRHTEQATTEKYYRKFSAGFPQTQVRHFTGRERRKDLGRGLTALELLRLPERADVQLDVQSLKLAANSGISRLDGHESRLGSAQPSASRFGLRFASRRGSHYTDLVRKPCLVRSCRTADISGQKVLAERPHVHDAPGGRQYIPGGRRYIPGGWQLSRALRAFCSQCDAEGWADVGRAV